MLPEIHLFHHLGVKVSSSVDLTPSALLPLSTGRRAWAVESRIQLGISNPLPSHCGQGPFLCCLYTHYVLLGNSCRKHLAKGECQWARETSETGGN